MLALINDTGIIVVVAAVVMLFGASRIPQLARNLGEAKREFNRGHDQDPSGPTPAPTPVAVRPVDADGTVTLTQAEYARLTAGAPAGRVVADRDPR